MLEKAGHASHQCLPGTAVSTSGEVLTLVRNTSSFSTAFIEKLLKTAERSLVEEYRS